LNYRNFAMFSIITLDCKKSYSQYFMNLIY
jgi:hypothetical protein